MVREEKIFNVPVAFITLAIRLVKDLVTNGKTWVAVFTELPPDDDGNGAWQVLKASGVFGDLPMRLFHDGRPSIVRGLSLQDGEALDTWFALDADVKAKAIIVVVDASTTQDPHVGGTRCQELPLPDLVIDHHGSADRERFPRDILFVPEAGSASAIALAWARHYLGDESPVYNTDAWHNAMTAAAAGIAIDSGVRIDRTPAGLCNEIVEGFLFALKWANKLTIAGIEWITGTDWFQGLEAEALKPGRCRRFSHVDGDGYAVSVICTHLDLLRIDDLLPDFRPKAPNIPAILADRLLLQAELVIVVGVVLNGTRSTKISVRTRPSLPLCPDQLIKAVTADIGSGRKTPNQPGIGGATITDEQLPSFGINANTGHQLLPVKVASTVARNLNNWVYSLLHPDVSDDPVLSVGEDTRSPLAAAAS